MAFDPIALAHEARTSAELERIVLDTLQREIGFEIAFFASKTQRPTTIEVDARALEHAVATHRYDTELEPVRRAALQARGVAIDTHVLGQRDAWRRSYYRDFGAPAHGAHTLMAYLMLRGAPLAGLCLGRVGKTFSHAEVSLIESSLGALAVAWVSFHVPWKGKPLREMSVFDRLRASLHRDIVIRDRNGFREMVAGDLVWTRAKLDEPSRSGWFYVDLFHIVAGTASNRSRALFIGCGGAVGIRRFAEVYPGIAIDVVEIDARVVDLAMRWFDFGSIPNVQVHIADGHDFISRVHSSYDIIITDGYDATTTSLGSSTFFTSARRALREGGAMGFNAIGALSGSIQSFELAARAAFEHVRLVPVLDPGEAFSPEDTRNVLIVAQS